MKDQIPLRVGSRGAFFTKDGYHVLTIHGYHNRHLQKEIAQVLNEHFGKKKDKSDDK